MRLMKYAERRKVSIYTDSVMKCFPAYLSKGSRYMLPEDCFVPSRLAFVDSGGVFYPCFEMGDSGKYEGMGDIYEKTLGEIWHNDIHRGLIALALNRKCPRCVDCCTVEGFNSFSENGGLFEQVRRLTDRLVRGLIF